MINYFKLSDKRYYYIILAWFVLNLLQSAFTFLHFDEAYYYVYSRNLAWGYFDHPPMVALLSFLGYSIFQNELGLRLFHIIISTGTLFLIFYLLDNKASFKENLIIVFSFPLTFFHIAGFLAIPDTVLIFFALLFLMVYKGFLVKSTVFNSIALGLIGAAMVLSKYHGGIFLVFIFLSNIKLIKSKYAWLSLFILILCLLPHLHWQFTHDFPSFKYHLSERAKGFEIYNVFHYVVSQVFVTGLFTGWIVIYSVFVFKAKDTFDRTLKFVAIAFFLFFFLMSFRGYMEAHWTAIAMPLMMYIVVDVLKDRVKLKKWFFRLAIPGIVLLILARVAVLGFPPPIGPKKVMWGWDQERDTINAYAHDLPVVIGGSYKLASLYSFYSKKFSPALPEYFVRYTQYDFYHFEDNLIGKTVFVITPNENTDQYMVFPKGNKVSYFIEDNFVSYRNIKICDATLKEVSDSLVIMGSIKNESLHTLDYHASERLKPYFVLETSDKKPTEICRIPFSQVISNKDIEPGQIQTFKISCLKPDANRLKLQIRFYTFRGNEMILNIPSSNSIRE